MKGKKKYYVILGAVLFATLLVVIAFGFKAHHMIVNHSYTARQESIDKKAEQREKRIERQHQQFIDSVAKPAIKLYEKNQQVLPSVVIAQAILESNWGQSKLYQDANNPFGIKGSYQGQSVQYQTQEYINNKEKTQIGTFRKYPSVALAIKDHNQALNQNFIKKSGITSFRHEAHLLQKNHYATDPDYADKLIGVIVNHHLMKYDIKAINNY